MTDQPDSKDIHYHHHVDVHGVVLPTWVAILLSLVGLSASVVVLIAVLVFKETTDHQTREIRILDVHIQDIQNVLIRNGIAQRSDFAQREEKKP